MLRIVFRQEELPFQKSAFARWIIRRAAQRSCVFPALWSAKARLMRSSMRPASRSALSCASIDCGWRWSSHTFSSSICCGVSASIARSIAGTVFMGLSITLAARLARQGRGFNGGTKDPSGNCGRVCETCNVGHAVRGRRFPCSAIRAHVVGCQRGLHSVIQPIPLRKKLQIPQHSFVHWVTID